MFRHKAVYIDTDIYIYIYTCLAAGWTMFEAIPNYQTFGMCSDNFSRTPKKPIRTRSNPFKPVRACSSPTLGTCERNRSYPYPFKTRSKGVQKPFKSRSEPVRFFTRISPLQLYEFKSGGKALLGKYPYCCVNTSATL